MKNKDNKMPSWRKVKNILQSQSPSGKYKFPFNSPKIEARSYQVFYDILYLIKSEDDNALTNLFSMYDVKFSNDSKNLGSVHEINIAILSNFNVNIVNTLINNGFELNKKTVVDFIFEVSNASNTSFKILDFVLNSKDLFDDDVISQVYKNSVISLLNDKENSKRFIKYIDMIGASHSNLINNAWEDVIFQGDFLLNYNFGSPELKSILPKNITWDDCLMCYLAPQLFLDVNMPDVSKIQTNKNYSFFTHNLLGFLTAIEDIKSLEVSFNQSINQMQKAQKDFFNTLKDSSSIKASVLSNKYLVKYLSKENLSDLSLKDKDFASLVGAFDFYQSGDNCKKMAFTPESLVEIIAYKQPRGYLSFLKDDDGKKEFKKAISKTPILSMWIISSPENNIIQVLSKVDMSSWRDENNNNIFHYIFSLRGSLDILSSNIKDILPKNILLLLNKNNHDLSAFDIYKKNHKLDEEILIDIEKVMISSKIKEHVSSSKLKSKPIKKF